MYTKDYIKRLSIGINQGLFIKDEYRCEPRNMCRMSMGVNQGLYLKRMNLCVYQGLSIKDEFMCIPRVIYEGWV